MIRQINDPCAFTEVLYALTKSGMAFTMAKDMVYSLPVGQEIAVANTKENLVCTDTYLKRKGDWLHVSQEITNLPEKETHV